MNNAWQLAVVDYSLCLNRFSHLPKFKKCVMQTMKNEDALRDGDIVYVVNVTREKCDFGEMNIYDKAKLWIPSTSRYGYAMLWLLHPILTHKDIIDMELKFNIKLDDYV